MNPPTVISPLGAIFYPESDGLPMADNTKQLRWIFILYGNLDALFRDQLDVFVASNLNWYPVEGQPNICAAPDVFVVFGRPKGDRGSYKQWEEGGIPPTVAFEVLSPGNTTAEMDNKLLFYEEHGVEEYYIYDPDNVQLIIYLRSGEVLRRVRPVDGFVSPRLGIRFDLSGPELTIFRPDGQPFLSFKELEAVRVRLEAVRVRAERLAELSRKARRGQASAEELRELDNLEEQLAPPSA